MNKRIYSTGIDAAYWRSALSVISAFRKVATDAAAAVGIAGMIPLKLVVDIETRKHDTSIGTDLSNPIQIANDAMHKQPQDSANSTKKRLIPSIGEWTNRNHGHVNFYLTQLLTGHGCYRAYLHKYAHKVGETCPEYRNERETA